MSDFVQFILNYLVRALILAVPAGLLVGAALLAAEKWWKKKRPGAKFPWLKAVVLIVLAAFFVVLLFVTLIRGGQRSWRYANLHLFRAWREAWNAFSEKHWLNVLLNVAMFAPLGFLLPLLTDRIQKWYRMLAAAFSTTLAIETLQYILCRGLFDVDDLFCNTLGAMIGYWAVMAGISCFRKNPRKMLPHLAALLAVVAAIGGIFLAYERQPFGNFPDSAPFRVDTSEVLWIYDCSFPEAEDSLPVYRLTQPGKQECEAIGRAFLEKVGVTDVDVTYYNDEVYLREAQGNRILEVFYLDGSISYFDWDDYDFMNPSCDEANEETLRQALADLGITVPADAALTREEDGGYRFTADRILQGSCLVDGTLYCTWQAGYGIRELENRLLKLTLCEDYPVCSSEQALDQVLDGWLRAGDYFERLMPTALIVRSCSLTYRTDTKGFYRPVYIFEIESDDGSFADTVLIPATA